MTQPKPTVSLIAGARAYKFLDYKLSFNVADLLVFADGAEGLPLVDQRDYVTVVLIDGEEYGVMMHHVNFETDNLPYKAQP